MLERRIGTKHTKQTRCLFLCVFTFMAAFPGTLLAQGAPPSLRAGAITGHITIDGRLTEADWQSSEVIDDLRQTDPIEGAAATARTRVQVLADSRSLIIGIVCDEPDPSNIVSFSVSRDAVLTAEDHVRVVLGPFADGRSGYVFAVNPTGARYDGLTTPAGSLSPSRVSLARPRASRR